MRLAVTQPYLFPYLGFFQMMSAVDKLILYDSFRYGNNSFVHRNRYLATGQGPQPFSVSVHGGMQTPIAELRVDDGQPWRRKMKRSLALSYARSPYFAQVYPRVEAVVDSDTDRVAEITARSIAMVKDYLAIPGELVTSAQSYEDIEVALSRPDEHQRSDEAEMEPRRVRRLLMLCRREGATAFMNLIGGRALYSPSVFRAHGIDLWFVESQTRPYAQHNAQRFHPDLSVLDALFNLSVQQVRELLQDYRLVQ
jgi:hypothetical protein